MVKNNIDIDTLAQEKPGPSLTQLNEVSELSKRGYQLLKESLTDRAIECFSQILEIDSSNNYALVGMGDAHRKERKYKSAISFYQECLVYHSGNNYALFGLADCYKALGQFNRAIDIWEEYLFHDDSNISILTRIADAYRKVRNFKKSKEFYERVLSIEVKNSYALIGLGHLYYDFKDFKHALEHWMPMLELQGENVDIRVLTSIGNCFRKLKKFDGGLPYFERALHRDAGNFYALYGLADCHRGLGNPEQSLDYWERILEKNPENKVILTRAGDAYRIMNNLEMAEQFYCRALDVEYDSYAAFGLALIDKQNGLYENAIERLEKIIKRELKNPRFYLEAASCYEHLGMNDRAINLLARCLRDGIRDEKVVEFAKRLQAQQDVFEDSPPGLSPFQNGTDTPDTT